MTKKLLYLFSFSRKVLYRVTVMVFALYCLNESIFAQTVNNVTINQGSSATLTMSGCSGSNMVVWNTGHAGSSITVSPLNTTTYTASCFTSVGSNLKTNPGFESDLTDWDIWGNTSNITVSTTAGEFRSGSKGLRVNAIGGGMGLGTAWPGPAVTPGTRYIFSAWGKRTNLADWAGLTIEWRNSSGAVVGTNIQAAFNGVGSFQQSAAEGVAPAGAAYAYIQFWCGAGSILYIDDVVFQSANTPVVASGTVTVNTTPKVLVSSNAPVATGATIMLSATGGGTYSWSGPNGFTSTSASPTITNASASHVGMYVVTVTNGASVQVGRTWVSLSSSCSSVCDLDTLNRYNVIALSGGNLSNADIEGRSVFGGNTYMQNHEQGSALAANSGFATVVYGNLTTANGNMRGRVAVSGTWTQIPISGTNTNGYSNATGVSTLPFNFANAHALLHCKSNQWAALPATGTVSVSSKVVTLNGNNASGTVVFNLTAGTHTDLTTNLTIIDQFIYTNCGNASSILINISGANVAFGNESTLGYPSPNIIIINAHQATTVLMSGANIIGTLLAPDADVTIDNGHVEGGVFVNYLSTSNGGEAHYKSFVKQVGTSCTPSTSERRGICNVTSICSGSVVHMMRIPNFSTNGTLGTEYQILSGEFLEYADNTAYFYGRVRNIQNTAAEFDIEFNFTGKTATAGSANPYNPNGCMPFTTNGWSYYTGFGGGMTGVVNTSFASVVVVFAKANTNQHVQVGIGATGWNASLFGIGGTFNGTVLYAAGKPVQNFSNAVLNASIGCSEVMPFVCASCPSINQVINPDFETNVASWTASNGQVSQGTAGQYGNFLQVNNGDLAGTYTAYQEITIGSEVLYSFTGFAAKHSVTSNAKIYLEFYNGTTYISKTTDFNVTLNYDGWNFQAFTFEGETPINTTKVRIVGWCNGTALKFDKLSLITCGASSLTVTAANNGPICTGGTLNLSSTVSNLPTSSTQMVVNGNFNTASVSGFSTDVPSGSYGFVTNPNSNSGDWLSIGDHTTGTGNMMWFSDDNTASNRRQWYQTYTVTPNTVYTMSVWVRRVINWGTANPIFYWSVNGTQVGSTVTATTAGGWIQLTTTWNSGSTTSATFAIVQQTNNIYHDFAIDDVSITYPAATATYAWSGPGGYTSNIQNPVRTSAIAAMSGTYTVTVTSGSCSGTASTVVTVTTPTATIAGTSTICSGGNTMLTASGGGTYLWSTGATTAAISVSPTATTTYTVTVTNNGCTATATANVVVNALPAAPTATGASRCGAGTVTLTATPPAGATIAWYNAANTTQLATTNNYTTPSLSTTTTYNAWSVSAAGCWSATGTAAVATISPTLTATAITPNEIICTGATSTLNSIVSGGNGTYTYQWQSSLDATTWTNVSGATVASYTTPALTASTYYRVQVNSAVAGCTTINSAPAYVGVTNNTVTVTTNNATICVGGSATLQADASNLQLPSGSVSGLVAYYPFQNDLNDYSGSGLNLSGSGGTFTSGGLQLTTSSAYTSATTSILNNDVHTISYYVKFDPSPDANWRAIFNYAPSGTDRSPGIWRHPSSNNIHWKYDSGNTGIWGPKVFDANEWHHVVGIKNGATFTFYVNGVLLETIAVASPKFAGTAPLSFGGAPAVLRDFKIYNRALSATEVQDMGRWVWYTGSCGGTNVGYGENLTVSPTTTTNYFVRWETTCGNSACATATVTVNPATIGGTVTPATQTICAGPGIVPIQHTISGQTGTILRWEYQTPGSTVWNDWGGGGSTTAPGNCCFSSVGTWKVRAIIQSGICNSNPSSEALIVVVADPSVNISGTAAICSGATTTLTANVTGGTGTVSSYQWQQNISGTWTNVGTNSQTYTTAALTANQTYRVIITQTGNDCSVTSSGFIVTVNALPAAPTATGASRCGTGTVTLTGTPPVGSTIAWYNATNTTQLATTNNYTTPSLSTTTTYNARSLSAAGCWSAVGTAAVATINPTVTATATGTTVCANTTISLTANGGTSYAWSGPSSFTSTLQNPTRATATAAMAGTYTVTVTNASGCTATATATVVVNALPAAPTATGASRCGAGTVTLTGTPPVGSTLYWYDAVGSQQLGSGNSWIIPSLSATTTYTAWSLSAANCWSATGTAAVATINPTVTATATGSTVCANTTISLTANGGTSYAWSGPSSFTSTLQNPTRATATAAMAGTYTVTVTNASGCTATATANVVVNALPAAPTATGASRCGAGTVTLTATPPAGATIVWYDATNATQLATTNNYTTPSLSTTTIYNAWSVSAAGCWSAVGTAAIATINSIPSAYIGRWPVTLCSGDPVGVSAYGEGGTSVNASYKINAVHSNQQMSNTWPYPGANTVYQLPGYTNYEITKWNFVDVSTGNVVTPVNGGIYYIRNRGTNANLYPAGGATGNGTVLVTDAGTTTAHRWTVSISGSQLTLTHTSSGKVATVQGAGTGDWIAYTLDTDSGATNQKFTISSYPTYNYTWSGGFSNTKGTISDNPTTSKIYSLTITDLNGCTSASSAQIWVNNIPTATTNNPTICVGQSTTITTTPAANPITVYKMLSATDNLCVGTSGSSTTSGVAIVKGACTNNNEQNWVLAEYSSGGYAGMTPAEITSNSALIYFRNVNSGMWAKPNVIVPINGTTLVQDATAPTYINNGFILENAPTAGQYKIRYYNDATKYLQVNASGGLEFAAYTGGSNQHFTFTAVPNISKSFITWDNGLGAGNSKTVSPTMTTTYTATVSDIGGCSSNIFTSTVTVNTLPTASISGTATICNGASTTLTASGVGTYLWSTGATTASISVSPTVTTTYTVTVTNNGCTATASRTVTPTSISITRTVSACINQALQDIATVDVTVTWTNAPAGDKINVTINGKTEVINVSGGATSPQTVRFLVPASGVANQTITAAWENFSTCTTSSTFNAPVSCSTDNLACQKILYLCGDHKPADSDAWDHGFIDYLMAVGVTSTNLTPALTKPDATGYGLYNPMSTTNALSINLNNYTMIVVSPSTETFIAADLITAMKGFTGGILMMNYTEADDLGLTNNSYYSFQNNAYIDNTNQINIYNYDNDINPAYSLVQTGADYFSNADAYLWFGANNMTSANNGIYYHYTTSDALSGVPATHGPRTYLGYHMNGLYHNSANGGALPAPASSYFTPTKHLTLEAKQYLDLAIKNAAVTTTVVATGDTECVGATVNLYSTSTGVVSSYAWSGPNGFTSALQNPTITNSSLTHAGTYTVTVTNPSGCTATATATVVVNALPAAPTATGASRCGAGTVTLTATPPAGSTIAWYNATNTTQLATTNNYTTPSLSTTTTYNARSLSAANCWSATGTAAVATINPTVTATATGTTVCANTTISLTANGGTSYAWSGPSSFTSTLQNPTRATATAAMAGTYTVTVTNASGCTATATATVVVNALPAAPTATGASRCGTGTVTLTGTPPVGSTLYWYDAVGSQQLGSGNSWITPSLSATTTYTAWSLSAANCWSATGTAAVATINPTASVNITGANTICNTTSTTLTANASGGTGFTYLWSNTATTSAITVNPSITTTYTVTVTNSNGCSVSANHIVTVNALPTAAITGANIICNGTSTTLTAGGGTSYLWSNSATTATISVSPAITTTYSVTVTNANSCTDVENITVTVNNPVTAGTASNPSPLCQSGSGLVTINLFNQLSGEMSGGTWSIISGTPGTNFTVATGILNPNGLALGIYTFRYTVTGTAPCANDTEDINITINSCCPPPICLPLSNIIRN